MAIFNEIKNIPILNEKKKTKNEQRAEELLWILKNELQKFLTNQDRIINE